MAIDMIENNELGALASSRLGLRQFADDGKKYAHRNFTGDEEFYNLFGSKARKNSIQANVDAENAKWNQLPLKTCEDAQRMLDLTKADIETYNKIIAANDKDPFSPVRLRVAREWEGRARKKYVELGCAEKIAAVQKATDRKEFIDLQNKLADEQVQKAKADLEGLQSKLSVGGEGLDNKKILLYGGIGVGALILIALILKR